MKSSAYVEPQASDTFAASRVRSSRKTEDILLSIYVFSAFVSIFTIEIGFHVKLFMVLMLVAAPIAITRTIKVTLFEVLFVLLFLYLLLQSSLVSIDVYSSARMLLGMLLVYVYYSISKGIFQRHAASVDRALHISGWGLVVSSLALYLIGIYENLSAGSLPRVSWGAMYERGLYRLTGVWTDPNFAGLGMLFVILYALLWGKIRPLLAIAALMVFALCLSRGALLAGIAGLGAAVLFQLLTGRLKRRDVSLGAAVIVGASVVAALAWQVPELNEILLHRTGNISSGSGRADLWLAGLTAWSEHPLVGVGLYNFGAAIGEPGRFAHNTPLEVLVEGGLPAFLLYVLFAASALWHATRTNHKVYFVAVVSAFFTMTLTLSMLIYEGMFLLLALMAVDTGPRRNLSGNDKINA